MVIGRYEALAIGAAAVGGAGAAVAAVRWWARRRPRPDPLPPGEDRVARLHRAFQDPAAPPAGAPDAVLRAYWSRLQPLDLAAGAESAVPALPPE
ncbi:hypothetical protein [Streptomyces sp. NPDC006193]|uniref:hypothetical protein n=1 Tax=Streptomyces sp. NPDC006193 TaxID=3155717 RepID=UPI0033B28F7F